MNRSLWASFRKLMVVVFSGCAVLCGGIGTHRCLAYQQQKMTSGLKGPLTANTRSTTANKTTNAPGARTSPNETYAVVSVGDELRTISKATFNTLKKQVEDEYKQDLKRYQDSKKDKNNRDANTSKPVKKTVKLIKSTFKTQEEAEKYIEEKLRERGKSGGKKTPANW
jgi:hypothetical protein